MDEKQSDVPEKKFTPPPVTGYRTLWQHEVDLMNQIKALGAMLESHTKLVLAHLDKQNLDAINMGGQAATDEQTRIRDAEPRRWLAIAKTDFQTGLMALTRAVAQPSTF